MHALPTRIFLVLFIFSLICPSSLIAAPEQRIALVIGNSAYSSGPLKNPVNDSADMAETLKRLGFDVILKKNVAHRPMEEAIRDFGNRLKKQKGVGLFFYAGHGLQINGVNYLIPIGAKVDKETDVQFEAVNMERVLAEMANAENGLNIVMLDACRDNPFRSLFRSAGRGLAMISNAPTGTFISYSTAPNQVARDGSGRNSPYTAAILKRILEPGLTIEDVFKGVRQQVRKETGQVPWELSSLEGKFFFVPGETSRVKGEDVVSKMPPANDAEIPATEKRPSDVTANEIKRDGRFIAYDDGTVLDTSTNLMWASKDSGRDINWADAKIYCENYRGGGYTDWRMPKQNELAGLYDSSKSNLSRFHVTDLIQLQVPLLWASETKDSKAGTFFFKNGKLYWLRASESTRALPVRSVRVAAAERKDRPERVAETGAIEFFGMTSREITAEIAAQQGIATGLGVIIANVTPGSPADDAGIRTQDIILEVNRTKISSLKDYTKKMAAVKAGENVLLLVKRGHAKIYVVLKGLNR